MKAEFISVANMSKRTKPTNADLEAAASLRRLWEDRSRRDKSFTQEKGALEMGRSQGLINQYLNGKIPLGTSITLRFAKVLNVHPGAIRKELSELKSDPPRSQILKLVTQYDAITPEQIIWASNLKKLWLIEKSICEAENKPFNEDLIATEMGLDNSDTINKYLNGEIPLTHPKIIKFARFLKVDPWDIRLDLDRFLPNAAYSASETATFTEDHDSNRYYAIPRLDVRGSLGDGLEVSEEHVVDQILVNKVWLQRTLGNNFDALRTITGDGDSMKPTLEHEDLLVLDTSIQRYSADAIYAMNWRGKLAIKRLQLLLDGRLAIKSDNPAYDTIYVPEGELDRLIIVGRVVWVWKGLRL